MENLDFGSILGESEVNALFSESEETTETETQETPPEQRRMIKNKKKLLRLPMLKIYSIQRNQRA